MRVPTTFVARLVAGIVAAGVLLGSASPAGGDPGVTAPPPVAPELSPVTGRPAGPAAR